MNLYPQAGLFASGEMSEHNSAGFIGVKKRHPCPSENRSFGVRSIIERIFVYGSVLYLVFRRSVKKRIVTLLFPILWVLVVVLEDLLG